MSPIVAATIGDIGPQSRPNINARCVSVPIKYQAYGKDQAHCTLEHCIHTCPEEIKHLNVLNFQMAARMKLTMNQSLQLILQNVGHVNWEVGFKFQN